MGAVPFNILFRLGLFEVGVMSGDVLADLMTGKTIGLIAEHAERIDFEMGLGDGEHFFEGIGDDEFFADALTAGDEIEMGANVLKAGAAKGEIFELFDAGGGERPANEKRATGSLGGEVEGKILGLVCADEEHPGIFVFKMGEGTERVLEGLFGECDGKVAR